MQSLILLFFFIIFRQLNLAKRWLLRLLPRQRLLLGITSLIRLLLLQVRQLMRHPPVYFYLSLALGEHLLGLQYFGIAANLVNDIVELILVVREAESFVQFEFGVQVRVHRLIQYI